MKNKFLKLIPVLAILSVSTSAFGSEEDTFRDIASAQPEENIESVVKSTKEKSTVESMNKETIDTDRAIELLTSHI